MVTLTLSRLLISDPSIYRSTKYSPSSPPSSSTRIRGNRSKKLTVFALTKDEEERDESVPSWANLDSDEPPPWARADSAETSPQQLGFQIPFYVYLLASAITAIAAIGSVFEYINQRPVFGVVESGSIFYAPLLGFFTFTGIPTSAFLWFKSVQTANKEAEEQDRKDGFL